RGGDMDSRADRPFETTRWSLIDDLRSDDESRSRAAGDQLVRLYWPAVYGFLRRSGLDTEQAGEVTQAFFADVVLTRHLFEKADPGIGRLRSYLLTALKRYRVDLARRAKSHPDWGGPDPSIITAVESRVSNGSSPELVFDREWAIAVLDEARRRSEAHFCSNGRAGHWALFEARHITPVASGVEPPSLSRLAQSHGFDSPAAVAAALQVVRKRFRAALTAVLSEQNQEPDEQESRHVLDILGA
ncbi:MAG: hypothetical protein K8E66_00130, partial [Phycisphaerales bacterium]|nr:hypothetical protein [Phycisphaerales bacterium]